MDSWPVRPIEDRNALFNEHIKGLRANPWTRDAWLILFAERNTGMESGAFKQIMDLYDKTAAYNQPEKTNPLTRIRKDMVNEDLQRYYEQTEKNPGFTPEPELKMNALLALRQKLTENSMFYFRDCVTKNPFMVNYNDTKKFICTKIEMEEEMKRIKEFETTKLKLDTRKPIVTWSAKTNEHGEKQSGYNDDKITMLSHACYLYQKAMNGENALPGFPYKKINFGGVVRPDSDDDD